MTNDDLIARLESAVKQYDTYPEGVIDAAGALWTVVQHAQHLCVEAAAEIERLRAEIERTGLSETKASLDMERLRWGVKRALYQENQPLFDRLHGAKAERDKWYALAGNLEAEARRLDHERDALRALLQRHYDAMPRLDNNLAEDTRAALAKGK